MHRKAEAYLASYEQRKRAVRPRVNGPLWRKVATKCHKEAMILAK